MTRRSFAKGILASVLAICCLLSLCSCTSSAKEPSAYELLTSVDWISVTDGDVYSFYVDGTGKHGKALISYSFDESTQTLDIIEEAGFFCRYSMFLTLDGSYPRLFPESMEKYYVTADIYQSVPVESDLPDAKVAVDSLILSDSWQEINDDDVYSFFADGTGTHGSISLTYSYDAGSKTLSVVEGIGSLSSRSMTLNTDGTYPRLIPADKSSYYVQVGDYEEISGIVRRENMDILTSVASWQTVNTWSGRNTDKGTGDVRLIFAEGGSGRVIFYLNMTKYVDEQMVWQMLDNNTVDCSFTAFGKEMDIDLDIANKAGEYVLYVHNDPSIYYLPDI